VGDQAGIGRAKLVESVSGVLQVSIDGLAGAVVLLQGRPELADFDHEVGVLALGGDHGLAQLSLLTLLVLDLALVFGDELAEFVVGLVEVGVALVGVVEGGLDFVDVRLELLFLLDELGLGADFGIKTGLKGLEGARVVASGCMKKIFIGEEFVIL